MNLEKLAFITYMCIIFQPLFEERSDSKAKIEAWKTLQAVFVLEADQLHRRHNIVIVQSVYFDVT